MYCRHLVKAWVHGHNNNNILRNHFMGLKFLPGIGSDIAIKLLLKDSDINKNNVIVVFAMFNDFSPQMENI